ncbi:MAG: T9SS type A sorting domain-containing protein [Bacteroidota bacterium]
MRTLFVLIFLSGMAQYTVCQNTYYKILPSSIANGAGSTYETEDGAIIMCTSLSGDSFLKKEYIQFLKINTIGDTIATRKFRLPVDYYDFSQILKNDDDRFTAVGSSFNLLPVLPGSGFFSIQNHIIYYTFNSNLDSIAFKSIIQVVDTIQLLSMRDAIINSNNNIITLCEDMSLHNIMLLEASISGDSVRSSQLLPIYGTRIYSITQKKDLTGYLVTCEGGYNQLPSNISHIITLDNNLNFVAIDSLPGECAYISQIHQFNNNILVGGRAVRIWGGIPPPIPPPDPYMTEEYCIEKLDTDFNVIKQVFLSHVVLNHHQSSDDTISYPAGNQNFSFIDTNSIYTCHFRAFPPFMYPNSPNYYVIAKFNSFLDLKWQLYFGNDAFYSISNILSTTDGGCFVNGSRYAANSQDQDVFYLKLDSTGIFTSSGEPNMAIHSAMVFPNPGANVLYVEAGPQVLGNYFQLYNLQGIKMHEVRITVSQQQINTVNLPAGMYIWSIVKKGKIIDTGKWIKAG